MSIQDALDKLCADGRLFRKDAAGLATVERRAVYVTQSVNQLVSGPWVDQPEENFGRRVGAHLVSFIEDEFIVVRVGPPAADKSQVARLEPQRDVVELRCLSGQPSVRIFGGMAAKDCFVGLHWKPRYELKNYGSPQWIAAIAECRALWTEYLPLHGPLTGGVFPDDYFTGAIPA